MMAIERQVGDPCWIHGIGRDSGFTQGKVVYIAQIPGYAMRHYIVEIETHVDALLEVRDPFTVSDDPNKPIGAFRRSEEGKARLMAIKAELDRAQASYDAESGKLS